MVMIYGEMKMVVILKNKKKYLLVSTINTEIGWCILDGVHLYKNTTILLPNKVIDYWYRRIRI